MTQSQQQMFWASANRLFEANRAFLDQVNDPVNPMTREDLERLIEHRPERYGRFAGYLDQLPSECAPEDPPRANVAPVARLKP